MNKLDKVQGIGIGIDLGTTYSCVGVFQNDRVEIIPNDQGNRTTPSYVAFTETERMLGDSAKFQIEKNPTNTVFDVKRLIGRKFSDVSVQQDIKYWPFKVQPGPDDKPLIVVQFKNETKQFYAEEISAMVLSKMKDIAESYLSKPVKNAVITVPAYFNNPQRQATKDAGTIAGLNVLRIINEPTAAAIAYGLDYKQQVEKNILVFDLGGGTFDVSILTLEDEVFEVKATAGDTHLGGEDFNNMLVDYCANEFQKKKGIDIRKNPRAMRRLRTQCERAKRILSSSAQASIEVDALAEYEDLNMTISRLKFEELCLSLFQQCISSIQKVLKDANMSKSQIHEIVLVGGSSRIPKVIQLVTEYFNGKEPNRSINPDEAVAYGAAIQAAILTNNGNSSTERVIVIDIIPLSLGIGTSTQVMTKFIVRGRNIPTKISQIFTTYADNQRAISIQVYEGERCFTKDNNCLGKFNLEGIPPAPRGSPQINVTFDIDENGILNLSAKNLATNIFEKITVTNQEGRFTESEIQNLIYQAEKLKADDEAIKKRLDAQNSLENYMFSIRNTLKDEKLKNQFSQEERQNFEQLIDEAFKWIQSNQNLETEFYKQKKTNLEEVFNPLMMRIYGQNEQNSSNDSSEKYSSTFQADEID
ncbi:hypothetical protein ABPG74_013378 [Tetrahymena malaccensis]